MHTLKRSQWQYHWIVKFTSSLARKWNDAQVLHLKLYNAIIHLSHLATPSTVTDNRERQNTISRHNRPLLSWKSLWTIKFTLSNTIIWLYNLVWMQAGLGQVVLFGKSELNTFIRLLLIECSFLFCNHFCHRNGVSQASEACRHSPKHFIFAFTVDSTVTLEAAGGALNWGLGALGKCLLWFQLWGIGPRASGWVISRIIKTQSCISKWNQATFTVLERTSQWVFSTADENPHKTQTADKRETTERNCEFLQGSGFTRKHRLLTETQLQSLRPNTIRLLLERLVRGDKGCLQTRPRFSLWSTAWRAVQGDRLRHWGGVTTHRLRSILQTRYKTQSGKFSSKSQTHVL